MFKFLFIPFFASLGTCLSFSVPSPPPKICYRCPVTTTKKSPFSFAIISDTHDKSYCGLGQGHTAAAVDIINKRRPDFVIGVGDLVAGGGDCKRVGGPGVSKQLLEFKRKVLQRLKVPFVPITGNHDMDVAQSLDQHYSNRVWSKFWKTNARFVLPAARCGNHLCHHRFVHKGIGFNLISFLNYGLTHPELNWIRRNVKEGDFVFRHVNPYGLSCGFFGCGFAMRSNGGVSKMRLFTDLLKQKKVRALFASHTHAFYDGVCDGLRYINTGSTGTRAMEYNIGWGRSPYKNRQAFVWVDVLADGTFKVSFYVWDGVKFVPFDKRHFPAKIKAKRRWRFFYREGVKATCRTVR